eukprot:787290-Pelagomonas_calceolata.AAC.2
MQGLLLRPRAGGLLPSISQCWKRGLKSSSSTGEAPKPVPVALSKLKDSFNDATSGTSRNSPRDGNRFAKSAQARGLRVVTRFISQAKTSRGHIRLRNSKSQPAPANSMSAHP